jgi:hypothetical protein
MTGFCGVGIMLKIYKFQSHPKCPHCEEDDESTLHVLQCQQTSASSLWERSIQNLEQWMTNNLGHSELVELIILGLAIWYNNE